MEALRALGAVGVAEGDGPVVVAESGLNPAASRAFRASLADGQTAVVLAQPEQVAAHFPVAVTLEPVVARWGLEVLPFTTDHGAMASLPRNKVLVGDYATVQAAVVVTSIEGERFPDTPVVIAYEPASAAMTGTIVGSHRVGAGRMVLCQYRLTRRVAEGDPAATTILSDLLRWACQPRPTMQKRTESKADGRAITYYTWNLETGR